MQFRSIVEQLPLVVYVDELDERSSARYVSPLIEGSGRNRQYRVWAEVENPVVDGHFVVQPGASAELQIDILAAK